MVAMKPKADFITGCDAEFIPEVLRDDDLTLGSDAMGHTDKYNFRPHLSCRGPVAGVGGVTQ